MQEAMMNLQEDDDLLERPVDKRKNGKDTEEEEEEEEMKDDNDENTVADYIRPLKKKKNDDFIKLNSVIYKRDSVRQTQMKGVSLGANKEFGSIETKELTNMFYKNNLLLPAPTKNALSDYLTLQVKLLFGKLKPANTKVSITKSAPIFILEAIHNRLNLLFQQVLIHINPDDNRVLNRALCSSILLNHSSSSTKQASNGSGGGGAFPTLHLLNKNGHSKRFPLLLSSNGNTKSGTTEKNLKPIVLFAAIASLNPSMSHAQGVSPALFTQPASYDFLAQLHKIYIFLKDSTKSSHLHHFSTKSKEVIRDENSVEEMKKKKQEENKEVTDRIFTELQEVFQKDKCETSSDEKGSMFFCGKGLVGLYKKYGINRSSQFNKFILEAYVCLFVKELAYKIFVFMVNNETTQINVDAVRWALKDYGYSC